MLEIKNVRVYDLTESVIACRNAMRIEMAEETEQEFEASLVRAKKLCKAGSPHDNFLCGIRVSYDIVYPQYISPELQRYHFNDIVASSSKMHRLCKMDIRKSCNCYVTEESVNQLEMLVNNYNVIETMDEDSVERMGVTIHKYDHARGKYYYDVVYNRQEALYQTWMEVISNCPMGLELFMRCSTNYLQLKNIYRQRNNHKLKEDWGEFCKFIEVLPHFEDFINIKD